MKPGHAAEAGSVVGGPVIMGLGRHGSCLVPGMMRLPPGPWSGWHWEKVLLQGTKTVGLLPGGPVSCWVLG